MDKTYIESTLSKIGAPRNLKGYNYIIEAILLLDDPNWQNAKWIDIYNEIGIIYGVPAINVERAIRFILNSIRNKLEKYDTIEHYFGYTYTQNSATLDHFYEVLKLEEKEKLGYITVSDLSIESLQDIIHTTLVQTLSEYNIRL